MRPLPPLGAKTVALAFARRHESLHMRRIARSAIRDAKLWKKLFS